MEAEGGFIGTRDATSTRIEARIVREVSADERDVDLLVFEVSRSADGSMLLARSSARSREEHGNPSNAGQYFYVELPTPRPSARAISQRLLTCASPTPP
jgi:hypothetical protein